MDTAKLLSYTDNVRYDIRTLSCEIQFMFIVSHYSIRECRWKARVFRISRGHIANLRRNFNELFYAHVSPTGFMKVNDSINSRFSASDVRGGAEEGKLYQIEIWRKKKKWNVYLYFIGVYIFIRKIPNGTKTLHVHEWKFPLNWQIEVSNIRMHLK